MIARGCSHSVAPGRYGALTGVAPRGNLAVHPRSRTQQLHAVGFCLPQAQGGHGLIALQHAVSRVEAGRCAHVVCHAILSENVDAPASTGVLEYGASSAQGLRDTMEDVLKLQYDENGKYLYAGVFDGHGGPAAAEWLGEHLHTTLSSVLNSYESSPVQLFKGKRVVQRNEQLVSILVKSFQDADQQLLAHLEQLGGSALIDAGSTASVAVVKPDRIVLANVGDSQAFLSRNGRPLALVTPHRVYGLENYVQSEVDRVKATGGWIHDGRVCNVLAVSRAFGDWEFKGEGLQHLLSNGVERGYWSQEFANAQSFRSDPIIVTPDATETDLTEEDEFLVMATDGLWDVLPPEEAMRWARKEFKAKRTAKQVADSLVSLALKRYTSDNVAVIVVNFKGQEYYNPPRKAGPGLLKTVCSWFKQG